MQLIVVNLLFTFRGLGCGELILLRQFVELHTGMRAIILFGGSVNRVIQHKIFHFT